MRPARALLVRSDLFHALGRRAPPPAECFEQHLEQQRLAQRLDEARREYFFGPARVPLRIGRRQQDQRQPRMRIDTLRFARELHAVHAGHVVIQNRRVKLAPLAQQLQRDARRRCRFAGQAPALHHGGEYIERGLVVIDQQQVLALNRELIGLRIAHRHRLRGPRVDGKTEPGSLACFALNAHRAVHQFDQPRADSQPQARAAKLARGARIGLVKRLKQFRLLGGGDADAGVAHDEFQRQAAGIARAPRHAHIDLAALGEFHAVVHQIDQHLPQPCYVSVHPRRHIVFDKIQQFEAFLLRHRRNHAEHLFDAARKFKRLRLQLHFSGLHLGKIQHIIDDRQQRGAAGAYGFDVFPLFAGKPCVEQQPGHADHAIHRRANFMAHARQKRRFCFIGLFGAHCFMPQIAHGAAQRRQRQHAYRPP